jgi:hypothetical protein
MSGSAAFLCRGRSKIREISGEDGLMRNTVVAHFSGGALLKGVTNNFFPNKERFHLTDKDTGEIHEIALAGLKALFFVKAFDGDPAYCERTDVERTGLGKKIEVVFNDGETLVGYSQGFDPHRSGFFVFPADPQSNNDRIFVVTASTASARFIDRVPLRLHPHLAANGARIDSGVNVTRTAT